MSKTQKSAAIALLAKGLTQAETARKLGISRQIVSYWLKCPDFQREVERTRIDFLVAQEPQQQQQEVQQQTEVTLVEVEKIQIPVFEPGQTFKSAFREKELLFLEEIQRCLMPQLLEGSLRAANALIKISERRSKLYGLDLKPYEILEAFQVLVDEGCAPKSQISIVRNGLNQIQEQLKSSTDAIRPIEDG